MRWFVSLLLIPMCLLGNPLPHAHCGSGASGPADHAARPHIHLLGGHHPFHSPMAQHRHGQAGHNHDQPPSQASTVCPMGDHEADAFYLADWSTSLRSTAIELPAGSDGWADCVCDVPKPDACSTSLFLTWRPPMAGLRAHSICDSAHFGFNRTLSPSAELRRAAIWEARASSSIRCQGIGLSQIAYPFGVSLSAIGSDASRRASAPYMAPVTHVLRYHSVTIHPSVSFWRPETSIQGANMKATRIVRWLGGLTVLAFLEVPHGPFVSAGRHSCHS